MGSGAAYGGGEAVDKQTHKHQSLKVNGIKWPSNRAYWCSLPCTNYTCINKLIKFIFQRT